MIKKKVGIIINSNNISFELNDFLNQSKFSKYYKVEYLIINKYYVFNRNLLKNLKFLITNKISINFFKLLNIFSCFVHKLPDDIGLVQVSSTIGRDFLGSRSDENM